MLNEKTLDRIRELTKTGKTQKQIAKILTAEGHRTASGRPFTQPTVSQACINLLGVRKATPARKSSYSKTRLVHVDNVQTTAVTLDKLVKEVSRMNLPDSYKIACLRAITELK